MPGKAKLPERAERLSTEVLQQRWEASRDSSSELLLNSTLACVMRWSSAFVAFADAAKNDSTWSLHNAMFLLWKVLYLAYTVPTHRLPNYQQGPGRHK